MMKKMKKKLLTTRSLGDIINAYLKNALKELFPIRVFIQRAAVLVRVRYEKGREVSFRSRAAEI